MLSTRTLSIRSLDTLADMFDCIPNTNFFVKDLNGRFVKVNQQLLDHLELTSDEVILGKTNYDFYPKFVADVFTTDDNKVFQTQKSIKNRLELIPGKDFNLYWFIAHKFPLLNSKDELIGLIGFATLFRKSEQKLYEKGKLDSVIDYLQNNYEQKVSIDELADMANVSGKTLERNFKKLFNTTVKSYLRKVRIHASCNLLK